MIGYHVCSGADEKTTSQLSKISNENSVRDKSSTLPRSFFQCGSIQMKMSDYHLLKHGVTAIRSPVLPTSIDESHLLQIHAILNVELSHIFWAEFQ